MAQIHAINITFCYDRSFDNIFENVSFSIGTCVKVLLAGSLLTTAHPYIWDEPLNYIDIFQECGLKR